MGIGSSAGGLEALEAFFEAMPSDSGMAFVVVTHLPPDGASLLPTLLSRRTRMPVEVAADGVRVQENRVYAAGPGVHLGILGGALHLMEPGSGSEARLPIDYFFNALARDHGDRAICVVLSGTGTDGTLGLRAVKAHAGLALVQDELSAQYDGMPRSAAATRLADHVLSPAEMPARLVTYVTSARQLGPTKVLGVEGLDAALPKIYLLLRQRLGHDFSGYKRNTMQRRIERRMRVHHLANSLEYVRMLQAEPHELDLLFQELLITVTQFFRDPPAFEQLSRHLAARIERESLTENMRIWVPGCSTGEEAYSIAMLALELLERAGKRLSFQVFATDLDPSAVEQARAGIYPAGIAADVSKERLQRFFVPRGSGYRICKAVRDRVVFATHDLLRDPPFTKIDLLSCRNLLIYLDAELQQRVFPMFHYALRSDAILWLGTSESATGHTDLFEVLDRQWRLYKRRESLSVRPAFFTRWPSDRAEPASQAQRPPTTPAPSITKTMESLLLERFVPATLVVNERGDIAYIYGRTGAYLELSAGEPRHNILSMAREGLRVSLQSAIRAAVVEDREITHHGVEVRTDGHAESVTVIARQIREPESLRGLIRVSLAPTPRVPKNEPSPPRGERRTSQPSHAELNRIRDSLRGTLDELQNSNEELKSANEELQSMNEELQSTNEELESSKEELQSLNEELQTVNAELEMKVDELAQVNDDMQNMLNGTDIATLFLDRELRIKRFTEQARSVIRLIASDVDRPIGDLVSQLRYERLTTDAEEVLRTLLPHEAEVQALDGRWLLVRILPYRTGHNVIDGVVITFIDIDRLKGAELLAASRAFAESIVQTVHEPLLVLDEALRIVATNQAFAELVGGGSHELVGQRLQDVGEGEMAFSGLRPRLERIITHGGTIEAFELTHEFAFLGQHCYRLSARRLVDVGAGSRGHVLIVLANVDAPQNATLG